MLVWAVLVLSMFRSAHVKLEVVLAALCAIAPRTEALHARDTSPSPAMPRHPAPNPLPPSGLAARAPTPALGPC